MFGRTHIHCQKTLNGPSLISMTPTRYVSISDLPICAHAHQIKEVYDLLSLNYVEDDEAAFRFKYSAEFLEWYTFLIVKGEKLTPFQGTQTSGLPQRMAHWCQSRFEQEARRVHFWRSYGTSRPPKVSSFVHFLSSEFDLVQAPLPRAKSITSVSTRNCAPNDSHLCSSKRSPDESTSVG